MTICGLKLTHDSSVALIEDNRLVFCVELEKLENNNRYKIIENVDEIEQIISAFGYSIDEIDHWVVDGWVGDDLSTISIYAGSQMIAIPVNGYQQIDQESINNRKVFNDLKIAGRSISYSSYTHSHGHIAAAYGTSPFVERQEDSFVLVWDGGMFPQLYYYVYKSNTIEYIDSLFFIGVNIYSIFSQNFGPFKINHNVIKDELSIAGKVMAYIAKGEAIDELEDIFEEVYQETIEFSRFVKNIPDFPYLFATEFKNKVYNKDFTDEDVLCSFHKFLERKLIGSLQGAINKTNFNSRNLCCTGGAFLNIKWNSAIRETGYFEHLWIPPFPNDSGSAIGQAICEKIHLTNNPKITWDVYCGPKFKNTPVNPEKWKSKKIDMKVLAMILHQENEPVVFINKQAELGPRALGNRSLLANPSSARMKEIINNIKYREQYRPIAPVCIEERAADIFSPSHSDPYMLFDYKIKDEWKSRLQAVEHIDGTARLQTVNQNQNPALYSLLKSFEDLSGIPVLCNSSANLKGSGFFNDLNSIAKWNSVNYIWWDGVLYFEKNKEAIVNQLIESLRVQKSIYS